MITSPVSSLTNSKSWYSPTTTAFMNSAVTLTDILALVSLVKSVFTSMNSSRSGWLQFKDNINAPRLPFCPIRLVVKLYKSMNDTAPVVSLAALFIEAPLGASFETSIPHPPP